MIAGRNIVCLASNWREHPTSKHHVMRALAQHNHVLWVNYHASRRPQLTRGDACLAWRRFWQTRRTPQRVQPHVDVLSPLLLPLPESRWARWLNARLLARCVRAALRRLPEQPVQLWLFTPDVPEFIHLLPAERTVYYCVDEFSAFTGFNRPLIAALEAETMSASDVVLATSQRLFEERRRRHPQVHFMPHGVDFEHFATATELPAATRPADVRDLSHPVLGYMGLITDYVDLQLIADAARARPSWSFVFIGDVRCPVDAVAGLRNVHLLGPRPYEQLPAYCAAFDVGLIPFHLNALTRAVNPIKLREYLAAGLPVVSAPLVEVLPYAPAVQTAVALNEFLAATDAALHYARTTTPADRQALVRAEGWTARVARLAEIVVGSIPGRPCQNSTSDETITSTVSPTTNTAHAASE